MRYTDRFIRLPCTIYNPEENELLNKSYKDSEKIEVMKIINPNRIESYGESIPVEDFREDNKVWTNVTMQSGDDFIANITIEEFETILNNHQKKLYAD